MTTTIQARLDQIKQEQDKLNRELQALIEEGLPEILDQLLSWVEVLNTHTSGDRWGLKRGIYNVTSDNRDKMLRYPHMTNRRRDMYDDARTSGVEDHDAGDELPPSEGGNHGRV